MSNHSYRSCFVVDVSLNDDNKTATLIDSTHRRYSIDLTDKKTSEQFKSWFHGMFLKGVPQQLTVFEYMDIGEGVDFDCRIVDFCNLKRADAVQLNG